MTSDNFKDITPYKKKLFGRLYSSKHDFSEANFCAHFLLKKGWHANPWERRGSIYGQQTAFVTNLIVAYSRPFTRSKGWPDFPQKIVNFSLEKKAVHDRLIQKRHEVFAHSDSQHFKFEHWHVKGLRTTIERVPFAVISAPETQLIAEMTSELISAVSKRLDALHNEIT